MRQHLDIADVESRTKIRAKYLRALENEEFGMLPGPTFVKTFLRTYAELLGLDPHLILEDYRTRYESGDDVEHIQSLGPPNLARDRRRSGPRLGAGSLLLLILVGIVGALVAVGLLSGGDGDGGSDQAADTTPETDTTPNRPRPRERPAPSVQPVAAREAVAGMIIGYARTSTVDQEAGLKAQLRDLEAAGAGKIFQEQVSSVGTRPHLAAALDFIREGDTLVVTRLDRLARSTAHLLQIVETIESKEAALRILDPDIDTSTATGQFTLTVLGAIG